MYEKLKQSPTIKHYKDVAFRMASINRSDIPYNVLSDAIDYSIAKRFIDSQVEIENNYKKKRNGQRIKNTFLEKEMIREIRGVIN